MQRSFALLGRQEACWRLLFSLLSAAPLSAGEADVDAALAEWRATCGEGWNVELDTKTGLASELYGGRLVPDGAPTGEDGFRAQAEQYLAAARGLFGLAPEELAFREVAQLPLAKIGSSDKVTVSFAQSVAGVRVEGAYANVLMGADGRLLSIVSWTAPGAGTLGLEPALDAEGARFLTEEYVRIETELAPGAFAEPELVIYPYEDETTRVPMLAWKVWAGSANDDMEAVPLSQICYIDAQTGALLECREGLASSGISGTVESQITQGVIPLHDTSPVEWKPMGSIKIWDLAGQNVLATTEADGSFIIANGIVPLTVRVRYEGAAVGVNDVGGSDYELIATLTSPFTTLQMNPSGDVNTTAEANAYYWVNHMREWLRATNPTDATWETAYQLPGRPEVQVNYVHSACNAFANASLQRLAVLRQER